MASEFKSFLAEFSRLANNYCENAKRIALTPDDAKLVEIYQAGLTTACEGLRRALSNEYDSAPREWRRQADEYVALTGALQMFKTANERIGKGSMKSDGALSRAGGIFHKGKQVLRDIPGVLQFLIPFIGGVSKLLDIIDLTIDNIREAFGSSDKDTKGSRPVLPAFKTQIIKPCDWFTVPNEDGKEAEFEMFSNGVDNQVEVREDGQISPRLLQGGFTRNFKGKKVEAHLRPGGVAQAEVSYRRVQ